MSSVLKNNLSIAVLLIEIHIFAYDIVSKVKELISDYDTWRCKNYSKMHHSTFLSSSKYF